MPEFRIVLPDKISALSNRVYFSVSQHIEKYVRIAGSNIYTSAHHTDVVSGCVALNAKQRGDYTLGQSVDVEFLDMTPLPIGRLHIEIDTIRRSTVDCLYLEDTIKRYMTETILTIGQQFVTLGTETTNCICKVHDIGLDGHSYGIFTSATEIVITATSRVTLYNQQQPQLFNQNIDLRQLGIGGLDREFERIFRRAFASRVMSPKLKKEMGIKHIKGVLLYGPPGCGKTLLARKIGQILNCKEPKVVSGPSLLSKYVGDSEKNVRDLFQDAIHDRGNLHLIICDEFDALCKHRGSSHDGTGVADNIVNQFLTMIDGPEPLDNILLVCMTNRKDLIDPAILRPGRLELHIEVNLPDTNGRYDILRIHTTTMESSGHIASDVDLTVLAEMTKNYTGAELEGLVNCATHSAIHRTINLEGGTVAVDQDANPIVTMRDFLNAAEEVVPMFGKVSEDITEITRRPFIYWDVVQELNDQAIEVISNLNSGHMYKIVVSGKPHTGKTKFVAHLAKQSKMSCIRMVTPEKLLKVPDRSKYIIDMYEQCLKSDSSILILDNLERLVEWSIGYRFNNQTLQTIMTILGCQIKNKIVVLCTSGSASGMIKELELVDLFDQHYHYPTTISQSQLIKHFNHHVDHQHDDYQIADVFRLLKIL